MGNIGFVGFFSFVCFGFVGNGRGDGLEWIEHRSVWYEMVLFSEIIDGIGLYGCGYLGNLAIVQKHSLSQFDLAKLNIRFL